MAGAATYSYAGPPVPIPDGADLSDTLPGAPATASITVAGEGPFLTDSGQAGFDYIDGGAGTNTIDGGTENDFCTNGAQTNCP